MAYFFGFFGISFLDTNAMARSPSSFGLSHLDQQLYAPRDDTSAKAASGVGGYNLQVAAPNAMCAKETPSVAGAAQAAAAGNSGSIGGGDGSSVKGASQIVSSLGPIPEGEEYSSMTDDEVGLSVWLVDCVEVWSSRDLW